MNYHNIKHDDMLNGDGIRVTLFVSGCVHNCPGCQNPETHPIDSGIEFDDDAKSEIFEELSKDYISGITFSGGDPLHPCNVFKISELIEEIREKFPNKTIWIYTGYCFSELPLYARQLLATVDVFVEGRYVEELRDVNMPWVGSINQRVIRNERGRDR